MPWILPVLSAWIMYGPTATRYCVPYVVGACLSSGATNAAGQRRGQRQAERVEISVAAPGFIRWMTIVVLVRRLDARQRAALVAWRLVEPTIGAGEAAPK